MQSAIIVQRYAMQTPCECVILRTDCAMSGIESHAVSTQKLMTPINHELQSKLVAMAEAQTASSALNLMAHGSVADWF